MKLGLVGHNSQEIAIFKKVFSQKGFSVSVVNPVSQSYLDLVKIEPEIMFMEIPTNYAEELCLLKRMQNNKKFHHCHMFTFGTEDVQTVMKRFSPYGVVAHIRRPLKIQNVFEAMLEHIGEEAEKYFKEGIPLAEPVSDSGLGPELEPERVSGAVSEPELSGSVSVSGPESESDPALMIEEFMNSSI
ncbi:MAG: hypothetical protein OCD01_03735 [Fibrobacterales bacterium]